MVANLQCLHASLYEILTVAMEMASVLIPEQKHSIFYETTDKVFLLYFHMLYTKDLKRPFLQKLCDPKFIICMIFNISMIILTQTKGNFPQLLWMKQLFGFKGKQNEKEFDDEFDQIVIKVMEIILGR